MLPEDRSSVLVAVSRNLSLYGVADLGVMVMTLPRSNRPTSLHETAAQRFPKMPFYRHPMHARSGAIRLRQTATQLSACGRAPCRAAPGRRLSGKGQAGAQDRSRHMPSLPEGGACPLIPRPGRETAFVVHVLRSCTSRPSVGQKASRMRRMFR